MREDCLKSINSSDSKVIFDEISPGSEVTYAEGAIGAEKLGERSRKGPEDDGFRDFRQSHTREFPVDQLTPITAYAAVGGKGSCLLETAPEAGEGRHSFIGISSAVSFTYKVGQPGDPYDSLRKLEKELGLPAVGFATYDAVRIKEKIPERHPDVSQLPDLFFQFYHTYLTFDHAEGRATIVAESEAEIDRILNRLMEGTRLTMLGAPKEIEVETDLSDADYRLIVEKAKKRIVAGDVFQIVPSRTFRAKTDAEAFQIYRALRMTSPAPYLFFFEFEDFCIAGASPEKLISVQDGRIESMPIAGTIKAGGSVAALLNDPKEIAEHVMLVDLARNDLGSVCIPGSVKVVEFKQPHRFSHVTHIVSRVVGQIDPKFDALDAFKASFPAGTLSGAPKVRAMELIDELETSRRGLYGGAIVTLDGKGNLKSCIAIRMALIKDGTAYVRAGGGVVLDSDPQKEADETRLKASTVLDALRLAAGGTK